MKKIFIPESAEKIINKLKSQNHEAYIVGGCVRDSLLGRVPYDYDITTSALPEEIKSAFERTIDTGISHGTVTVLSDGIPYEVTTFRIDGEYLDSRHPSSVSFTKKVEYDQARRDFTVNALCYNHESGIIDSFGGIGDLNNKIIRAVGDPNVRFSEDALRVFRAIRFAATLGFDIEEKTAEAIRAYKDNLKDISAERIFVEWKKLLAGEYAYDIIRDFIDVIAVSITELYELDMPIRDKFDALSPDERQIILFARCGGKDAFLSAVKRLKMDNRTKEMGTCVLDHLYLNDSMSDADLKIFLQDITDEGALICARICEALGECTNDVYRRIYSLIEENTPRRISQLAINGRDLLCLGFMGKSIGETLDEMLRMVAKGEIANELSELLAFASSKKNKS